MSLTYRALLAGILSELARWLGYHVDVELLGTTINTLVTLGSGAVAFAGQFRAPLEGPAQYVPSLTLMLTALAQLAGVNTSVEQIGTTAATVAALVAAGAGLVTRYRSGGITALGIRTE